MSQNIDIHYATESEAAGLGRINIVSFQHQAFWANVMPGIKPESCLPLKQARCLEKLASPSSHVFSAVDTSADRVVGYSRWTIPWEESKVDLSEEGKTMVANAASFRPLGMREDIYEAFFKTLKARRDVHLKEGDMVLDLLATLPECQGQGVGTKLLQWGIQQADARNARIYLEATPDGLPLYQKYGWRKLEDLILDYAQYGGTGKAHFALMMREPHSHP
ncbi:GNAT family N-acetyltransferase [Aspergillus alliaceus]|uniref:GNAT family N-acetyltransferase n=1 Tax=Petromyces alliaceus TaxID=209559 RepID=UPI0012A6F822|nr:acyl-CoA N-acyltransferase [Aspergillus alliaceus]KAB8239529.1 acyl-CoA N-acyltransferase [Aspergillus alliaceus]